MLNLFDSHTHSDNSPDGTHSITFMAEKAIENGIMGFAVTDHCEVDVYKRDSYQIRMIQSMFEVRKAQLSFGDRLMLTSGLELGQALFDPETATRAVELQNYDMVLGSVHVARGCEDFFEIDYTKKTAVELRAILEAYFQEVYETVQWGGFDVCAHLTYPLRYMTGRDLVEYDLAPHADVIDAILKELVERGKGLEINTSGLFGGYGRCMPERDILRRFCELGGEIVTLGSDAHQAGNIGNGIERGMEMLEYCGLRYFAFYKKRSPRMLSIR